MKTKSFLISLGLVLALSCAALTTRLHRAAEAGSDEANVAEATARLLENSHYAAHRFDADLSARFLDRYLEALDPGRQLFLESDVEEFAPYRTSLEETTVRTGDTGPEHRIFERFEQRLEERAAFVQELLKVDSFDFTGNDDCRWDRQNAARPRDLAEAKQLWRQQLRYDYLQEKLANKKPEEIIKTLSRRYERGMRALKQLSKDELLEVYLTALAHAYDPHSDYMGRRQVEDFGIAMNLSLVGIGATLQSEDGYCKIRELVPGGPAARSKALKQGDRIVAVAQEGKEPVDVIDMPLPEAVTLIRGAKGTKVRLTFIPADAADSSVRKTITLVRDEVHLEDQEAKARIVDLDGEKGHSLRLGIIDLPSFYSGSETANGHDHISATADTAKIIRKLKQEKVQGIILDLRRNGGGSLEEAISLTGLFIKRGPVVQTKDTDGDVKVEYDPDPSELYEGPLIVLTSRFSASASEILAGALQDYGRAIIVGDSHTFGKGTVQSMLPLERIMRHAGLGTEADPGALKLTIREFYRPGGASTQLRGVASDIVVPSPTEVLKIGEADMVDPLPWDAVTPARHADFHLVAPFLSALREKSTKRVTTDQELGWLKGDMERARARRTNPVVSLNEKQRRQEKTELDAQAETRKKERNAHPPAPEKQYEITLKNADAAGLPEPMSAAKPSHSRTTIHGPNELEADDSANADKNPAPDVTLEETKRILADYIGLLHDRPDPVLADSSQ